MYDVAFKKGLLRDLPKSRVAGTIYITTDERAIYLDTDSSTRIRLGDFQEFDSITDLKANQNPSQTALYYVKDINCLAKYDGSDYIQINPDTGAVKAAVEDSNDNGFTMEYDQTSRTITLKVSKAFVTGEDVDSKIDAAIEKLDLEDTYVKTGALDTAIDDAKRAGTDAKSAAEQVRTDLTEEIGKKQDKLEFETPYDSANNKAATMTDVKNAVSGLSGAMHWQGEKESVPTGDESGTYKSGDVVSVNGVEYAYDGERWVELGDESSKHTHNNLITLEKITEDKLTGWDAAATQAAANKTAIAGILDGDEYSSFSDIEDAINGLSNTYDAKGDADAALTNAKTYTDTALTWGSF